MQAVYHVRDRDLTWRERAPFLRYAPYDSAIAEALRDGPLWTVESHLLDDVRMWLMAVAGVEVRHIKPHPDRPLPRQKVDPARELKVADWRRRMAERRRMLEERRG